MKILKTSDNSLKIKRICKSILILQLVTLLLVITISQAASPSPAPEEPAKKLAGTWLYLWWHGTVSVGNTNGTTTVQTIFTPESYNETGDQKTDSFMRFRADGTGTFFSRHVMFKNKNKKLVVITQDPAGSWIEKDVLVSRYDFTWEIRENKLIITAAKGAPRFNTSGKYDFAFNTPPTRSAVKELQQMFGLKDELIINMLGQFLKLGEKAESDLNKRYGI